MIETAYKRPQPQAPRRQSQMHTLRGRARGASMKHVSAKRRKQRQSTNPDQIPHLSPENPLFFSQWPQCRSCGDQNV